MARPTRRTWQPGIDETRHVLKNGAPDTIRTCGLCLRRATFRFCARLLEFAEVRKVPILQVFPSGSVCGLLLESVPHC